MESNRSPYASYINVNAFLNHIGSSNLSLLSEDTAAIYGYDASEGLGLGFGAIVFGGVISEFALYSLFDRE